MTQTLISLSFEHRVERMSLVEVSGRPQCIGEGAFVSTESAAAQGRDETLRQLSDEGSSRDPDGRGGSGAGRQYSDVRPRTDHSECGDHYLQIYRAKREGRHRVVKC